VATERRKASDRRKKNRRRPPSESVDVTRLEHENLYGQVEEVLRSVRRIEHELHMNRERIAELERDLEVLLMKAQKGA